MIEPWPAVVAAVVIALASVALVLSARSIGRLLRRALDLPRSRSFDDPLLLQRLRAVLRFDS